jgi:hypothetical protein
MKNFQALGLLIQILPKAISTNKMQEEDCSVVGSFSKIIYQLNINKTQMRLQKISNKNLKLL